MTSRLADELMWLLESMEKSAGVKNFADIGREVPDTSGLVCMTGKYLIFHLDLTTRGEAGAELGTRDDVRAVIDKVINGYDGLRLTQSVYLLNSDPEKTAMMNAVEIWNAVQSKTKDMLHANDSFFLHYSDRYKDRLGGIGQVVQRGAHSLRVVAPRR